MGNNTDMDSAPPAYTATTSPFVATAPSAPAAAAPPPQEEAERPSRPPPPYRGPSAPPYDPPSQPRPVAGPAAGQPVLPNDPNLQQEVLLVQQALETFIPVWQQRIDAALQRPTPLRLDLNAILGVCSTTGARLHAARTLLQPAKASSQAALETLVQALESVCVNEGVRRDICQAAQEVVVVNNPAVVGTHSVMLQTQPIPHLLFAGCFEIGVSRGVPRPGDFDLFFEQHFHAQERLLISALEGVLQEARVNLSRMLDKDIPLFFDSASLDLCQPERRLIAAKALCCPTVASQALQSAKQKTDKFVNKMASSVEKLFGQQGQGGGSAEPFPQQNVPPTAANSPNVVQRLVNSIAICCQHDPTSISTLARSIKEIHIVLVPGRESRQRGIELRPSLDAPALAPQEWMKPNPPMNCVLVYSGAFEAGESGCIPKKELDAFFESVFHCEERGLVGRFMSQTIPRTQTQLRALLEHPVTIEIAWDTILTADLTTSKRLQVTRMLCDAESRAVALTLVQSIQEVILKDETATAKNMLQQNVHRILIQGSRSRSSLQHVPDSNLLVYSAAFTVGPTGLFGKEQCKAALRSVFALAVPKSDSGINSTAKRIGEDLGKLGDSLAGKIKGLRLF